MSALDETLAEVLDGRHLSVRQVASWFMVGEPDDFDAGLVREAVQQLAVSILLTIPDSAELTNALRKVLEAQDSLLRASVGA